VPTLSAIQCDLQARAFHNRLLARDKKKMQALVAVMRKTLAAIWAAVWQPASYDSCKFYASLWRNAE
jgi:type II secretory pathway component PulM